MPFAGIDPDSLKLADGALVGPDGRRETLEAAVSRVAGGALEVLAENTPKGLPPSAMAGPLQGPDDDVARRCAQGRRGLRVRRALHRSARPRAYARNPHAENRQRLRCGTIVNPLTAYSQFMGGAIWGVSSALHESTEIDPRRAAYVNRNLADYRIPVNADIDQLEVIIVPEEDDKANPLGVKGIGEIGIVGMNAAVANAVFHATGKRVRDLPIRIDALV